MQTFVSLFVSCTLFALATSQSLSGSFHISSGVDSVDHDLDTIPSYGNRSVECGNAILNATSGSIEYKVSESLQPNERCVWLIRFAQATGYSVALSGLGFREANADHKLTITSFDAFNPGVNVVLDHLGLYQFNATNVLVVTLHTGSSENVSNITGFSLGYKAFQEGESLIDQTYLDWFHDASMEVNAQQHSGTLLEEHNLHFIFYTWMKTPYDPRDSIKFAISNDDNRYTPYYFLEAYTYDIDSNWKRNELYDWFGNKITSNDVMFLVFRSTLPRNHFVKWNFMNFFCKGNY